MRVVKRSGKAESVVTDMPPATLYSEEYFLSHACEGFGDYLRSGISLIKSKELDLLGLGRAQRFLDLGCGRGEVLLEGAKRGAVATGIDYSADAVRLSRNLVGPSGTVVQADGSALPFRDKAFDRVLLGDVIEHIPWETSATCLREVDRVLALGGRALVHTSPNTWFISLVKPLVVFLLRRLHRQEVLDRFSTYDSLREVMHPNELNPLSFRRLARQAGVKGRIWVDPDVIRSGQSEWTKSASKGLKLIAPLSGMWPLRVVLGNDLYLLITKPLG